MRVSIDGERIFGEAQVEFHVGGCKRECVERSIAGLNGSVSIDCGSRGRIIRQKGRLRSVSRAGLLDSIERINGFMDGGVHELISGEGRVFQNVRVDEFEISEEHRNGGGFCVDYVIKYKQLVV